MILATHSPEFVHIEEPKDLARIVFFSNASTPPAQVDEDAGELKNKNLPRFLEYLRQGSKDVLFSSRVLLVEGDCDRTICLALERCLQLHLGLAGTAIVPVNGKDLMGVLARLFRSIGKEPIVLCDLDGYADSVSLVASFADGVEDQTAARKRGHDSITKFAKDVYNDFCQTLDDHWTDIADEASKHSYWRQWQSNPSTVSEKVARRRAAMATVLGRTDSYTAPWVEMAERLSALFDVLKSVGFFILRKGTIEDYYMFCEPDPFIGKKEAALAEATKLADAKNAELAEQRYADIVRALKHGARAAMEDEVPEVRQLVLQVAAPALDMLNENTTDSELYALAEDRAGRRAKLLRIVRTENVSGPPSFQVDLDSTILAVEGFPLGFSKDCNPNQVVQHLRRKSPAK